MKFTKYIHTEEENKTGFFIKFHFLMKMKTKVLRTLLPSISCIAFVDRHQHN